MKNYNRIYILLESLDEDEIAHILESFDKTSLQGKLIHWIWEDVQQGINDDRPGKKVTSLETGDKISLHRDTYQSLCSLLSEWYKSRKADQEAFEKVVSLIEEAEFLLSKKILLPLAKIHFKKIRDKLYKRFEEYPRKQKGYDPFPLLMRMMQLEIRDNLVDKNWQKSFPHSDFDLLFTSMKKGSLLSASSSDVPDGWDSLYRNLHGWAHARGEALQQEPETPASEIASLDRWMLYRLLNAYAAMYQVDEKLLSIDVERPFFHDPPPIQPALEWLQAFETLYRQLLRNEPKYARPKLDYLQKVTTDSNSLTIDKGLQLFLQRRLYEAQVLYGSLSASPEASLSKTLQLAHSEGAKNLNLATRAEIGDFLIRFELNELLLLMFGQEWEAAFQQAETLIDKLEEHIRKQQVMPTTQVSEEDKQLLQSHHAYLKSCQTDLRLMCVAISLEERGSQNASERKDYDRALIRSAESLTNFQQLARQFLKEIENTSAFQRKVRNEAYRAFLDHSFPDISPFGQALRYWFRFQEAKK